MKKVLTALALVLTTLLVASPAQAGVTHHPHHHRHHHKTNPCYTHPRPDWAKDWSQAQWIGYCNMADPALWH